MVSVSRDGARTFAPPVDLADKLFDAPEARQQMLSAVTTTVPAPGATTPTTTIPPAGSKAAQPNQAANFGASTNRGSMTAGVDGKGKLTCLADRHGQRHPGPAGGPDAVDVHRRRQDLDDRPRPCRPATTLPAAPPWR